MHAVSSAEAALEQDPGDPFLPPEIEREIFEMAASQGNAVNLMLVARRTQVWIEQFVYKTVTLSNRQLCDKFLRTLDNRSPDFFTAHVKSLCIPGDIEQPDAERVLKACQGVDNLAIWLPLHPNAPLFPFVSSLRPIRLSINVPALCGSPCEPDLKHPFFSRVTHLELVDWRDCASHLHIEYLSAHLTHLALDFDHYTEGETSRLRGILASCPSLVVCLGLVSNDNAMIIASDTLALAKIDDPRLVILSESDVVENWEASLGSSDESLWAFAEGIVASKTR
ncbi:hypothetical protein C8R46DRAFT_115202 [Mycena filopes]|nr:hypothetical protein C8R46DRAFT_115202 [Mycena filopes]